MTVLEPGRTVFLLAGSRFKGRYDLVEVGEPDGNGWQRIRAEHHWSVRNHEGVTHSGTSVIDWHTWAVDAFTSEAAARVAARERRAPRRARVTPYGDHAQLAAFLGWRKVVK